MKINKENLLPFIIYDNEIKYNEHITLYPVTMNDILTFQLLSQAITVRKNSTFHEKTIIKMTYLDFLLYCLGNEELEKEYKISGLSNYFLYAIQLLQLCCKDAKVDIDKQTGQLNINNEVITPKIFDDLRRIIIIQNDIDFNIDEFLNYDTEQRLLKARKNLGKNNNATIEDYIDSLVIAMNTTEDMVKNMTIRKFWRLIKRFNLHENYIICKTGEASGMVKYKESIKHWMNAIEENDEYEDLKMNEKDLRGKIS